MIKLPTVDEQKRLRKREEKIMQPFNTEDILHEDDDIIVCHKHAGMAVQSARSSQIDMESALRNYLSQKSRPEEIPYVGIIQRLDQPVEGVIIFAKTPVAAKELNRQMQENEIEKIYMAVVKAPVENKEGKLENYLLKDGRTNTSKVVDKGVRGCKKAILSYKVWGAKADMCVLGIKLQTGRHHQIRVQLANVGMPIIGDKKYNPVEDGIEQLALCAHILKFKHPTTGKEMTFEVLPENEIYASARLSGAFLLHREHFPMK